MHTYKRWPWPTNLLFCLKEYCKFLFIIVYITYYHVVIYISIVGGSKVYIVGGSKVYTQMIKNAIANLGWAKSLFHIYEK